MSDAVSAKPMLIRTWIQRVLAGLPAVSACALTKAKYAAIRTAAQHRMRIRQFKKVDAAGLTGNSSSVSEKGDSVLYVSALYAMFGRRRQTNASTMVGKVRVDSEKTSTKPPNSINPRSRDSPIASATMAKLGTRTDELEIVETRLPTNAPRMFAAAQMPAHASIAVKAEMSMVRFATGMLPRKSHAERTRCFTTKTNPATKQKRLT